MTQYKLWLSIEEHDPQTGESTTNIHSKLATFDTLPKAQHYASSLQRYVAKYGALFVETFDQF